MKHCVHGMGYMSECGDEATTKRQGWPLCGPHAAVWDGFTAMAEQESKAEEFEPKSMDFVAYARDVRAGRR